MKRIITSNTGEGSRDQGIWVRGRVEESGIYAANRVNLALLGSNCSRVQRRERYIHFFFFFLFTFTDYTDIVSLFEPEITSIISGRWLSSVSPPPYACTGHVSVFCNPRNRTATRAEINIFVVRELEPRDIS